MCAAWPISTALTALRGADLKLEIEEERPQPGAAPGVILEQDPTADTICPLKARCGWS